MIKRRRLSRRAALAGAGATLALPAAARRIAPQGVGLTAVASGGGGPVTTLPDSPLPRVEFGKHGSMNSPGSFNMANRADQVQFIISSLSGYGGSPSGVVELSTIGWANNQPGTPGGTDTMTAQWMVGRPTTQDVVPLSPYITSTFPFYFTYDWDTTTVPDGTYVVYLRFIDTVFAAGFPNPMYTNIQGGGVSVIVANHSLPLTPPAQTVAVTIRSLFGQVIPALPDFVTYAGTPWPTLATHSNPSPSLGFIPPLAGDAAGLIYANWHADDCAQPRLSEYEESIRWTTTPVGGVFMAAMINETGFFVDTGSYENAERRGGLDGGRCNATIESLITIVAAPDGLSWYGAELLGRIIEIGFDGSITTVYGKRFNRSVLPYDQFLRVTEPQQDSRLEFVGTGGLETGGLNDMCFDPRDPDIFYFVNTLQNYIGVVRESTGAGSVYAGVPGTTGGLVDGAALSAQFNQPTSILMSDGTGNGGPIGTMYVADMLNSVIRVIAPSASAGAPAGAVSTLVGKQPATDPAVVRASPPTYMPTATISGYANIYVPFPFVIRWTSARNLVVAHQLFASLRELDLSAHTSRLIGYFGYPPLPTTYPAPGFPPAPLPDGWIWFDCDYAGAVGPVDFIRMFQSVGGVPGSGDVARPTIWHFSLDGTVSEGFNLGGTLPVGSPPIDNFSYGPGHYPWALAFSRTQARMAFSGIGNTGGAVALARWKVVNGQRGFVGVSDPVIDKNANPPIGLNSSVYRSGGYVYRTGTCCGGEGINGSPDQFHGCFPWNSRPSLSTLLGSQGNGQLGAWPGSPDRNTFEDLMVAFPSTTPGDAGDVALGNYIRSGMGGTVPRPEITGNDLRDIIYFIRRSTTQGSYPVPVNPAPDATDHTPPVILTAGVTRVDATTIHVTWTTDKACIGFVAVGTPGQQAFFPKYGTFSDIEAAFVMSHSMTVPGCAVASPLHVCVVAKDLAGNCVHSSDLTVA